MLDKIIQLDIALFKLINSTWTAPWADSFFPMVTDLHKSKTFGLIFIAVLLTILIRKLGRRKGLIAFSFMVITVLASDGIGNYGFKKTVQRPRPANTENTEAIVRSKFGGYSFVSNHATNTFAMATFTSMLFPGATIPLFLISTTVAYSRIYNGVHFPLDVIVGGLLGSALALIFFNLYLFTLRNLNHKKE